MNKFQKAIKQGIPATLPPKKELEKDNPAPNRKQILSVEEKKLALKNALRYFPKEWHSILGPEFKAELESRGRIYMYRFKPAYNLFARSIDQYPAKNLQAASIMLMIHNNLDPKVAQHPNELITYGGNGAVFQNWAQYLITMQWLSEVKNDQTIHLYSGHPMGIFPSSTQAPRVVVTNGMMIPNYSKPDDLEKFNAMGVTQYGQMTAGSFMYIGPQGIVHGTTITVMNAFRKVLPHAEDYKGQVFVTSGLGGMSGAQPKAGNIVGCITVCAEVNKFAAQKRHEQGWVDELIYKTDQLINRVKKAMINSESVSIAFVGNVVTVWEEFFNNNVKITIGSDQTSLHNPYSGGYYPVSLTYQEGVEMIKSDPERFKKEVKKSLIRHAAAIAKHTKSGTYFFDYGNAFLLEASRAGGDVMDAKNANFRYKSYMQDILGPQFFDYGFGPFRWVCTSGNDDDLDKCDKIAFDILQNYHKKAPTNIKSQLSDNIEWIKQARQNKLVVGSKARILYADAYGRLLIGRAFNNAIKRGDISAPVVLGRDHHDVSGTDSPYRETSNIYDGSRFTADMAIHNVIGDSFRGATWVSIHNGGGVGWGEVINGGFGLLLDGSRKSALQLKNMIFFDVNNGISRRSWAGNQEAIEAIELEMKRSPKLKVNIPIQAENDLIDDLFS